MLRDPGLRRCDGAAWLVAVCGLTLPGILAAQEARPGFLRTRSPSEVFRSPEPAGTERAEESDSPFEEHLETDRDSFTPSSRTANRGRLVTEAAYSFIDNRATADTHSFPELVFRYGLTERVELRFGANYEVGGGGNVVSGVEGDEGFGPGKIESESRLLYGIKIRTTDQDRWIPESSVILEAFTPTSGEGTDTEASATYIIGWELPDDWKLDAALRYGTDSDQEDDFATWDPSIVLRVPIDERWNVHAEYFAIAPQGQAGGRTQHLASTGVHYLLTPDLEVGVRVGWGCNEPAPNFFVNSGVGWRY